MALNGLRIDFDFSPKKDNFMSRNAENIEREKFEERSLWLRERIAPDDIYDFAEQTIMCAEFFLMKFINYVELEKEMRKDKVLDVWVKNIVSIRFLKNSGASGGKINTELKHIDDL